MKVAFVVQRYGEEVCGGAELECRLVAEHLAPFVDVDVLTSCALNHLPWDNFYPPGESTVNGIRVRRFPVDRRRDERTFERLTYRVFGGDHTLVDEMAWVESLGPDCPRLLSYIAQHRHQYDLFFFFTYQYFQTVFGVPIVSDRAILVPCAHDDRSLYLDVYDAIFHLPKHIIYQTATERALSEWRFRNQTVPHSVIGTGIYDPGTRDGDGFRARQQISGDIVTYVGRIEPAKGCGQLFDYFARYKDHNPDAVTLVLLGKPEMPIPVRPDVRALGFVSDEEKFAALAASTVVVLPSESESLSIVNLEAWMAGAPVLVNGSCKVLKENCLNADGGLFYTTYDEFAACLHVLLDDPELRRDLATSGGRYVEDTYGWDGVVAKYLEILERFGYDGRQPPSVDKAQSSKSC